MVIDIGVGPAEGCDVDPELLDQFFEMSQAGASLPKLLLGGTSADV